MVVLSLRTANWLPTNPIHVDHLLPIPVNPTTHLAAARASSLRISNLPLASAPLPATAVAIVTTAPVLIRTIASHRPLRARKRNLAIVLSED
jgi:hypothetical protein